MHWWHYLARNDDLLTFALETSPQNKVFIYDKDGECAVETVTPIVIDGKTCTHKEWSSYDGICK